MMYNKKKFIFEKKYFIGRIFYVNLMISGSVNDWFGFEENVSGRYC